MVSNMMEKNSCLVIAEKSLTENNISLTLKHSMCREKQFIIMLPFLVTGNSLCKVCTEC